MHELSLAADILQIVQRAARAEPFDRVRTLRLSVPALAGVEPQALRFALQAVAPDTLLEGAELVIDEPPGQARCRDCGSDVRVVRRGQACPHCGSWQLQVTGGTRLQVVDLIVQ